MDATRASAGQQESSRTGWPPPPGGTWVLDLDGVVWLSGQPIAGVPEALARLHAGGVRTLFATNNSAPTMGQLLARLRRAGVDATPDDVVTSAQAAANLLPAGARVLTVAGPGVEEAMAARGLQTVARGPAEAVVVGWTDQFDFDRLAAAADAVRGGARLIGTNDDPALPTREGLVPGAGALLAAVATASGAHPEVAGKPNRPMAYLIASRCSDLRLVVGDRASTDGRLAERLGLPFALVFSGVTAPGAPVGDPAPAVTAADLGRLVAGLPLSG